MKRLLMNGRLICHSITVFIILFFAIYNLTEACAAANSNACLQQSLGPIVTIHRNFGFETMSWSSWAPGTKFDARGARWESHLAPQSEGYENCFPIQLNAAWGSCNDRLDLYANSRSAPTPLPQACFSGGLVVGTQSTGATWGQVKGSSGYAITLNAVNAIVEGMRVHNHADGFVPMKSNDFIYRHNWQSYTRDDCIENDAFSSGIIDNNLFDGCFVFYSALNHKVDDPPIAPGGGQRGVVTISNNMVRMRNMPGPAVARGADKRGYGHVFKTWDSRNNSPGLELHDNMFLIERPIDGGSPDIKFFNAELKACSNNTIVWAASGDYPGTYPKHCFTVTKDKRIWDRAKEAWIVDHPSITRLPSDLGYDPSQHFHR